jgi:NodT family efflux transporter outer membrane factor (OMF) lipoprotein
MLERPISALSGKSGRVRRIVSVFGTLCLVQTLSGCFVDTERPDLALDIPDRYRLAQGAPERALPALDWWRGFRSRELTLLVEEAQSSNLDIAMAVARIMQADAQARVAGAPLLPNVSGEAEATRSRASTANGEGGGGDRNMFRMLLSASYEIDFWGKNRAALLAAGETAVASRFDRDVVALTTMASVANAYFQVLGAQDRLRIARENLGAATRILSLIRERVSAGTASSLEVAQQEALVANLRATLPPLEIALRQNIFTLAVLVGRAPEHFAVKGGSLSSVTVPRVTPGLPSELVNQRPDIRQAEAQLVAANHNVESARAAFFPSIQLTGQTGFQSAALATLFGPGAWFYTMTASLTQPIFDGGRLLGQFELERGRQREALQSYRRAVINAFSDVEKTLIALQQQTLRERLQSEAVRSSRLAFNISEIRLREGTLDLITVLNTQQTLFTAQDTLVEVRLARFLAVVSLFQALGGGWPPLIGDRRA